MFGDEWHQVQDDCLLAEPFCTPDIYDTNRTSVLLYATDCGGFASAVIFFPALLILANYTVLNLFVGMIMNNFAYISCKGENGVLEPGDFERMSWIWTKES